MFDLLIDYQLDSSCIVPTVEYYGKEGRLQLDAGNGAVIRWMKYGHMPSSEKMINHLKQQTVWKQCCMREIEYAVNISRQKILNADWGSEDIVDINEILIESINDTFQSAYLEYMLLFNEVV